MQINWIAFSIGLLIGVSPAIIQIYLYSRRRNTPFIKELWDIFNFKL